MVHDIAQLGAGVLRQTASPVNDVNTGEIRQLIEDMHNTLATSQGVGLAAPQIGVSKQVIIVASRPTQRYPNAPLMAPTVMINPSFTQRSEEKDKDWEGCLSIPGIRALVPRYSRIAIHYLDEQGLPIALNLDGFIARVFQHEYDHLLGKVYLDRVEINSDIFAESEYFKLFDIQTANA
ncbi:MAG: peptide deformylase [Methylococcales bacterium]|nr:peptide deformylase [Methylococcaceae bacterium]